MQSITAFGTLNTAKIGMQVNLSETNTAVFTIKTTNPTDEILFVTLIPSNFIEINTDKIIDFNIQIQEYELQPSQSKETIIEIQDVKQGQYEGTIKVMFEKQGIKQKTSLNSVIQINAFGGEEDINLIGYVIKIIIFGSLTFLVFNFVKWLKYKNNQSIERGLLKQWKKQ